MPSTPTADRPFLSRHRIPILSVAALVSIFLTLTAFRAAGETNDSTVYFRAAAEIAADRSPYDLRIAGEERLRYVYPPVLAALLVPLSLLPEGVAAILWALLGLAALLGCLIVVRRLLGPHPDPLPVLAASLLAVVPFVRSGLRSGQVAVMLLFLILSALWTAGRGRPLRSGAVLGAAAAVKLYPAAAVLGWVAARRWKPVAAAAAFAVAFSLLVPLVFMGPGAAAEAIGGFWTDLVPRALGAEEAPEWFGYRSRHSQSLPSAMYRWFGIGPEGPISGARGRIWGGSLAGAGIFLGLAFAALRRLTRPTAKAVSGRPLLQAALVVGLLPILGPVSLKPAFTALLPVWAALFGTAAGGRREPPIRILAGAGLFLHIAPFRLLFGRDAAYWLEARSDVLIGAILIYLAMWLRAWRMAAPGRRITNGC